MADRPVGATNPELSRRNDMQKSALVRAEIGKIIRSEQKGEQKAQQKEQGQLSKTTSALVEVRGKSRLVQMKRAVSMSLDDRKAIANGDLSPFIKAFAFAISKDALFDPISATAIGAIIGMPFGAFISVYLFIFLWGKGKWKVRLVIFVLSCFDIIPVVGLLPLQTICVFYAYKQAKKHAEEVKAELKAAGVSLE